MGGYPGAAYAEAVAKAARSRGPIAMLAHAGFIEDQQVISYLARQLNTLGLSDSLDNAARFGLAGWPALFEIAYKQRAGRGGCSLLSSGMVEFWKLHAIVPWADERRWAIPAARC